MREPLPESELERLAVEIIAMDQVDEWPPKQGDVVKVTRAYLDLRRKVNEMFGNMNKDWRELAELLK